MKNAPPSAEINYLAASIFDEEISIRVSQESDYGIFCNHSILRTIDNKELCRIRIKWKEDSLIKVN